MKLCILFTCILCVSCTATTSYNESEETLHNFPSSEIESEKITLPPGDLMDGVLFFDEDAKSWAYYDNGKLYYFDLEDLTITYPLTDN